MPERPNTISLDKMYDFGDDEFDFDDEFISPNTVKYPVNNGFASKETMDLFIDYHSGPAKPRRESKLDLI